MAILRRKSNTLGPVSHGESGLFAGCGLGVRTVAELVAPYESIDHVHDSRVSRLRSRLWPDQVLDHILVTD